MTVLERRRRKVRSVVAAQDVSPEIKWYEGMLLMPQHFQLLARRQESLLHYHAAAMAPYHWGVRSAQTDLAPSGLFRVRALDAVMPNGLAVSARPKDSGDLSVDVATLGDEATQRPTRIYLAIRDLRAERYLNGELTVADEQDGGESVVQIVVPQLLLFAGDEPPVSFVSFPLAEVEYRGGKFSRTRYEPPCLQVERDSPLYDLCDQMGERVRRKARELADRARALPASFTALEIAETKALVHDLVGQLLPFEALVKSETAHPFPLYLALCSLAGHVAGLSIALVPPLLEPYDHENLIASFDRALAVIEMSLREGAQEAYTSYRFVREGETFRLDFKNDWMTRRLVLGVRSADKAPRTETEKWMEGALIGGNAKLPSLRERRVLGATRTPREADADLAPPPGEMLFTLLLEKDSVVLGQDLLIVNPGGGRLPEDIVLYVRNET
jgi:type VI secretion system protein ImpJ